jgi:HEAT repeat protein/beta-lactamase regulating signal transducer with metallopeptidase domain
MTNPAGLETAAWAVLSWLFTYAIHSTILLGAAFLVGSRFAADPAWKELLWKAALLGSLATASVQLAAGFTPLGGRWNLRAAAVAPAMPIARAGDEPQPSYPNAAAMDTASSASSEARISPAAASPVVEGAGAKARPVFSGLRRGWPVVLAGFWLAVAAVGGLRLAGAQWRLRRWLRSRRPVTDLKLLGMLEELRRGAGARRPVRLTMTPECRVPMAIRGREIVVPPRFLDELAAEEQRAGLAHELAHVLRRDPAWLVLSLALERLFFFQPLLRTARRALRESAEFLCDEWSVRQTGSPVALARCLEAVVSWLPASRDARLDLASPMALQASPFVRRVERMLAGGGPAARRPSAAWLAVPLVAVIAAAPVVSSGQSRGSEPGKPTGSFSGKLSDDSLPRWSAADLARARAEARISRPSQPLPPLPARWRWALDEAASRNLRDFWIVYGFHTPIHANDLMMGESDGMDVVSKLDGPWSGPSLAALLEDATPIAGPANVAVLVRYRAAREGGFDFAGYRSMTLPYKFGKTPVFWLGYAEEARSFSQLEALFDQAGDDELRTLFIEAASLHPTTDLVLPFLQRLLDPAHSVAVRSEAAEGFDHHHDPRSVRILLATARRDPSVEVRAEAAETIGEVQVPEAIPALLELVRRSKDPDVRQEAAEGFEDQPAERALPAIAELLADGLDDDDVAMEVVETLAAFPGKTSFDLLLRTAESHPRLQVQQEAVETLGENESDGEEALEALARIAWEHGNEDVRLEAVETLGHVHAGGADAALLRLIWEHPDPDVQSEAVETLGDLSGTGAVPELRRVLRDHPNEDVRDEARETLGDESAKDEKEER